MDLNNHFDLVDKKAFKFVKEGTYSFEQVTALLPAGQTEIWINTVEGDIYVVLPNASEFEGDESFIKEVLV